MAHTVLRTEPVSEAHAAQSTGPTEGAGRVGALLDGKYHVEREIGRSGMGAVYLAEQRALGRRVAIKVLHARGRASLEAQRQFRREARMLARLDHPNIVRIYDLGDLTDDTHYLVMEHLDGEDLGAVFAREGALPLERACALSLQAARGLAAAHGAGIVHLDVKPDNLFVARGGDGLSVVKVIDFGISRWTEQAPEVEGGYFGTPPYMAPERLSESPQLDVRGDIWSLALVFLESVVGHRVFGQRRPAELFEAILAAEAEALVALAPKLPPPLAAMLRRALARDPAQRLAAVHEMAQALAPFAGPLFSDPAQAGAAAPSLQPQTRAGLGPRDSLPAEPGALIGREREMRALAAAFAGGTRLLTLHGPGGTGKTRLAVRFGWHALDDWPGGVWFADLSEARSLEGIVAAVAGALKVPLGGGDPVAHLGRVLDCRGRCLLILDNFEQVVGEAHATIGRWLDLAPDTSFLVTSREILSLGSGVGMPLEPLPEAEALTLFRTRAVAARPDLTFDAADEAAAVTLVSLLDHLPLAIELAASRAKMLSPQAILERMQDRFRLLATATGRTPRQATLRGALDWSWDLLSKDERAALAQLSVFEGGFSLRAAEQVLDLESLWPLDALQALFDKSLLRRMDDDRFGLLVSVHAYASEKLDAAGERPAAELRHGTFFSQFGTPEVLAALDGHAGAARRRELEREVDNLVAASRRALRRDDLPMASRTAQAAWASIELRGPYSRGVAVLLAPLALPGDALDHAALCLALGAAERLAGDCAAAVEHLARAESLYDTHGHPAGSTRARIEAARALLELGRVDDADTMLATALAVAQTLQLHSVQGVALSSRAFRRFQQGRLPEARADLEASIAILHGAGNLRREAFSRSGLATISAMEGQLEVARGLWLEAAAAMQAVGELRGEMTVRLDLGQFERELGHHDEAWARMGEALEGFRRIGEPRGEGAAHAEMGVVAVAQGRLADALVCFAAAERVFRGIGERYHLALLLASRALGRAGTDRAAALADLEEAERLAAALSLGPESEPARRMEKARRALAERASA
jgi:predicted ATPase